MHERIVARCQDCGHVTTAIYTGDGTLTVPGSKGCSACGGLLAELDVLTDGLSLATHMTEDIPLAGLVLQALLNAEGGLLQDALVRAVGRSPFLVRETLRQLETDGHIRREATPGGWYIYLTDLDSEETPATE